MEQLFHDMKGCRDGKSAKTSATRDCLYGAVVVNDHHPYIVFLTPKGSYKHVLYRWGRGYIHVHLQLHHLGMQFLVALVFAYLPSLVDYTLHFAVYILVLQCTYVHLEYFFTCVRVYAWCAGSGCAVYLCGSG